MGFESSLEIRGSRPGTGTNFFAGVIQWQNAALPTLMSWVRVPPLAPLWVVAQCGARQERRVGWVTV